MKPRAPIPQSIAERFGIVSSAFTLTPFGRYVRLIQQLPTGAVQERLYPNRGAAIAGSKYYWRNPPIPLA